MDRCDRGVERLDRFEQGDGGIGVDGVIEAHDRLKTFEIDDPVDVDTPSPGITRDVAVFVALDPAISKYWIMPRMGGVHEVD